MRSQALDEFRGLSMMMLTILAPLFLFDAVPSLLKHASKTGLHIADIIAPMFLFAIGVSYRISLKKRLETQSAGKIARNILKRYGIFIAFGLCGEPLIYENFALHWGVLETIGLTGIFVFPLMFLSWITRLSLAILLPMLWQIALTLGYEPHAISYDVGGPMATLAWSSFILCGSVIGELSESPGIRGIFSRTIPLIVGSCAFAIAASFAIPISKPLVSFSYILAGMACVITIFLLFTCKEHRGTHSRILGIFGKNSLVMYIISGFECLAIRGIFPPNISFGLALFLSGTAMSISIIFASYLDKKKIYIKI